ncbi:MAG: hypothetical protein ABIN67_25005 [Ferruginibacter sp.]
MAKHTMILDDLKHRTLKLKTDISTDSKYSVVIVFERNPVTGNFTNFLEVKSTLATKEFPDLKIAAGGAKIPPNVG